MSERDRHWLSKMEQKDLIQMLERNMPYTVATLGLLAYLSRVCCCCPESCLSGPTGVRGWLECRFSLVSTTIFKNLMVIFIFQYLLKFCFRSTAFFQIYLQIFFVAPNSTLAVPFLYLSNLSRTLQYLR